MSEKVSASSVFQDEDEAEQEGDSALQGLSPPAERKERRSSEASEAEEEDEDEDEGVGQGIPLSISE